MSVRILPSWRRTLSATVAAAGFLLVLPVSSAHAAYDPEPYGVRNINSSKCLEVQGWATGNGATVDQWDCLSDGNYNPNANQAWQFIPFNGHYQIKNANSGKCLEVQGWGMNNGATVDQWDCLYDGSGNPDANQLWDLGGMRFRNVNSGKCLEVLGWGMNNGATVDQWDCLTNGAGQADTNQQWYMAGPYSM